MKKILYIILGAAILAALTSCEPKFKYDRAAYVILDETSVSVAENAGTLTLGVTAYPLSGKPDTEVEFEVIDGSGENGARNGVDFTVVSPQNGILTFDGDTTAYITFRISDTNVGIYTGRKQFIVKLTGATGGYTIGGAYSTTVTITDTDRNLEGETIYGVYSASGFAFSTSSNTSWDLTISEYPDNYEFVYIEGLVPLYTSGYKAYGWLEDDGKTLVIPSQVTGDQVNTSEGETYYIGYTPCTQYSDGNFYYSGTFPNLTFYYDSTTDTWTSDYGVFFAGFTGQELSTMSVYFEAIAPTITMFKIPD